MINSMQRSLIQKDIKGITSNSRLFSVMLIVPLALAVFVPAIMVLTFALAPLQGSDIEPILALLPDNIDPGSIRQELLQLLINNIMPLFFLLIPIMASSVMAASSFVGEREKRTLETLLYSPLSLAQVFSAKILASFIVSMMVSLISFAAMLVVVELLMFFIMGTWLMPNVNWLVLMLLVSPALSLIAITVIVRGSAKAQTMEESQQRSVFLIMPIILLAAGQFTGLMLITWWMLLILGVVLGALALVLLNKARGRFTYETLLL